MTKSKSLSIASIMILVVGLVSIIFGVLYASQGTLMPYHEEYVGMTPSEISDFNPELMTLVGLFIRLIGFLLLSVGIATIGVCFAGFRKGERWSWITILFTDAVAIIPLIGITYIVGGFGMPFPIGFFVLILWVIAMCLSPKEALTTK